MRRSFPSCWVGSLNRSTSDGSCGLSRSRSVARSLPGTAGARSPAVAGHQDCATPITADTGLTGVRPVWITVFFCVRPIIGMCIKLVGRSSSALATSSSFPQRSSIRIVDHCATLCAANCSPPSVRQEWITGCHHADRGCASPSPGSTAGLWSRTWVQDSNVELGDSRTLTVPSPLSRVPGNPDRSPTDLRRRPQAVRALPTVTAARACRAAGSSP
jgi:hypothetical protein